MKQLLKFQNRILHRKSNLKVLLVLLVVFSLLYSMSPIIGHWYADYDNTPSTNGYYLLRNGNEDNFSFRKIELKDGFFYIYTSDAKTILLKKKEVLILEINN